MGERRQENSERPGVDHLVARVSLADLVADNDSRPWSHGSDGSHGVRPRQPQRSSLYEYGDHSTRSADFSEAGQVRSPVDRPAEVAADGNQIQALV